MLKKKIPSCPFTLCSFKDKKIEKSNKDITTVAILKTLKLICLKNKNIIFNKRNYKFILKLYKFYILQQ